jgi:hypothetical protein
MNIGKSLLCAGALFLALGAGAAQADGHFRHERGGVGFGLYLGVPLYAPPLYGPGYYPYGYGYPPPVVYSAPPVYAAPAAPQAAAEQYWYYCTSPQGYYPYVKQCPPGWMKVVPQAPQAPQ